MNFRILIASAVAAIAFSAFGLSPEHEEWAKGSAKHLMTAEETAQWKSIKSDDEAARFIALFWARRDPTPDTRRNEFREQYEGRARYADQQFAGPDGQKGSMTDRGRAFLLFGAPTRVRIGAGLAPAAPSGETSGFPGSDPASAQNQLSEEGQIWVYEGDIAKLVFNAPKAEIRFVDSRGKGGFKLARGGVDVAGAERRAIVRAVTQAALTEPPVYADPVAPVPVNAPANAPVIPTELTTESLKSAVAQFRAAPKGEKTIHAVWGEYVTPEGVTFVPVLVYVPKAAGLTAANNLTFFGVIDDASGKPVLAFEEQAKLTASKDDFFVDKTLTLGAGKHHGMFGLADGGKVVALVDSDIELTGALDKSATAASPLILSNNVFPLTEAQNPTDPYAFGGIKVVPKADKAFRKEDELWYFVELRNPGLPEGEGATPKIQVKLDVAGTDVSGKSVKMAAPPMEVEATEMKGVPHHYGIGSSIPLASFRPGDYTLTVKIIDTVKKSSYTLSDKFKVVE